VGIDRGRGSFEVDFRTVARWDNGEIAEENLFSMSSG
jgi:hypothetical protein